MGRRCALEPEAQGASQPEHVQPLRKDVGVLEVGLLPSVEQTHEGNARLRQGRESERAAGMRQPGIRGAMGGWKPARGGLVG